MATNNRISATMSAADITAILGAVTTIKSKLPFLISLQASERKKMRKLGQKRQGYFQDVADGVNAFPTALPSYFPTTEYIKDATLMTSLMQVSPQLLGIAANLQDTLMQLGSELLANSDTAYGLLKTAAKSDSNMQPTVAKIATGLKQTKAAETASKKTGNS
jgi:hypothetical protein